jgi:CheY-like chemotaxis protein
MLERIFDMFVQGRQPAGGAGGLGVGLALARKIAELHGGLLEARSEGEGKGSEFELSLALTTSSPRSSEVLAGRAIPRRILVVDDNRDAAASLAMFLETLGHETCVAHDGEQAVSMAILFRPDMVLLDIGMPGVDGYEVARRLRALPQGIPLRIVAVTGYGREIDRQRSHEAGVDEHLVKPVSEVELARVLGEASA